MLNLSCPRKGCEEMGKSKGKKKRTTPNSQEQISLVIEIIKLITAIISLIGVILLFLKEIGLFWAFLVPISIICKKKIKNNGKKSFNQAAYDSKYKKKFYKSFAFRFNLKEDKATMDHLENQADKTNYIKIPILSDIDKQKNKFF